MLRLAFVRPCIIRTTMQATNKMQQATGLRRSSISTMSPVGSNIGALYQKLYIQTKSAPEDGRVCCPKYVQQIQIDQ